MTNTTMRMIISVLMAISSLYFFEHLCQLYILPSIDRALRILHYAFDSH